MIFTNLPSNSLDIIAEIKGTFSVSICIHDHKYLIGSSPFSKSFHLRHEHPFCVQQRYEKKEWFENCRQCCYLDTNKEIAKSKTSLHSICWKNAEQVIHPVYEEDKLIFTLFAGPFKSKPKNKKLPKPYNDLPELSTKEVTHLKLFLHALQTNLLIDFAERDISAINTKSRKSKIEKYIDKNHDKNISLSSLAEELKLSTSRASHVIQEEFEMGFNDILLEVRILKAKRLLLHTSLSATEIAHAVGFKNANYFYVCFKKKAGQSPKEFKNQLKSPV